MILGVSGPYSAATEEQREENLARLNKVAVEVLKKGHVPLIGVNAALPTVAFLPEDERYEAIMKISMAVMDTCDALLFVAESPGANKERDLFLAKRLPIYHTIEEVPVGR